MIRHQEEKEFWLITQGDHALAAGLLAAHVGNSKFACPSPYLQTIDAIALHDSGWITHDSEPTLDGDGLPLHVFQTPPPLAVGIWTESVRRAVARDQYSGLLVSLHTLRLASLSFAHWQKAHLPTHELFELTRFQQAQIELQESLRLRLGMKIDIPLTLGLGRRGTSDDENTLIFNAGLLRLLDAVSLDVCGLEPLIPVVDAVCPGPGAQPISFRLDRVEFNMMTVDPWPFDIPSIPLQIPFRRFPAHRFADQATFQAAYAEAPVERAHVVVQQVGRE